MAISQRMEAKSLEAPDESRPFASHGHMDVVQVGEATVGRGVFEPGWRGSVAVKPIAGTDSCQANHTLYILSAPVRRVTGLPTEAPMSANGSRQARSLQIPHPSSANAYRAESGKRRR